MSQVQVSKLAGIAQTLGQVTVSPGHTLNVEGKFKGCINDYLKQSDCTTFK